MAGLRLGEVTDVTGGHWTLACAWPSLSQGQREWGVWSPLLWGVPMKLRPCAVWKGSVLVSANRKQRELL